MKKGFVFIETIIVVCVLTISLMSLYGNYSKILENTKELNTFDTTEYNYKTYFLKSVLYPPTSSALSTGGCETISSDFSDNGTIKICLLENITNAGTRSVQDFLKVTTSGVKQYEKLDAYIIDYLLNQDLTSSNDNMYLVEYKKEDKINGGYLTYISSLNY